MAIPALVSCLFVLSLSVSALPSSSSRPSSSLLHHLKRHEIVNLDSDHFVRRVDHLTTLGAQVGGDSSWDTSLSAHPVHTSFRLSAFGRSFDVKLRKSAGLFGHNYFEEQQEWHDGHLVSTTRHEGVPPERDCFYHGEVENNSGDVNVVAVNSCDGGFRGIIYAHGDRFNVDLARNHFSTTELRQHTAALGQAIASDASLHIVWRTSDMESEPHTCAVKDHDHRQENVVFSTADGAPSFSAHLGHGAATVDPLVASRQSLSALFESLRMRTQDVVPDPRYVELYVVNDNSRWKAYQQLSKAPESDSADIVNLANALYRNTNFANGISVNITLIGQTSWITEDPYVTTKGQCYGDEACTTSEVSVSKLLSNWNAWRSGISVAHDCGHLFSAFDFSGPALGYAGVGVMCSRPQSGGIEQMGTSQALNAAVLAHEIGHNFNMLHDSADNPCPASGYIMNAIVDPSNAPTAFSTCSLSYFNSFISGPISCLDDVPTSRWGDPICGNGYVEVGEDCDCLNNDCTADPCCFNCTFVKASMSGLGYDAQCSRNDVCCDVTCRFVSAASNTVCRAATGSCDVEEKCNGTSSRCPPDLAKGSGTGCNEAAYGDGLCYNGQCMTHEAQCRTTGATFSGGPYEACPAETQSYLNNGKFCSTLWCARATDSSSCSTLKTSNTVQKMLDGVPCGNGKQCYLQECVASGQLNPRFKWYAPPWAPCLECGTPQTRNISCVDMTEQNVANDERTPLPWEYCSPPSMPVGWQLCQNVSLGCVELSGAVDQLTYTLFGRTFSRTVLILILVGALTLFAVVVAACYQAATYGDEVEAQAWRLQRQMEALHKVVP